MCTFWTARVSGGFGARLPGIATKEEADALKGVLLFADRARLPRLPDDEFYHADLIGLQVVDTGGAVLGKILAVQNHGAGDILEVTGGPKPMVARDRSRFLSTLDETIQKLKRQTG